ncbi:glycosyltransferase family 1 protein [Paxillus rubicundulus Ve08.2h10]|uniref:UDP-N-acetylglucosamine transferase subunit ALG14 n=1 Tax=Paxillus rubicundulus Ve08.2h10 TaxID=930991 RepID=A0A0D0EAU6_9AGAM|nr:glycosyltransferase family 1 protein [Paxillus rubicundulus Ve08.2h10]
MTITFQILTALAFLLSCRVYLVLPTSCHPKPPRRYSNKCSLAIFLGSGGHTSEALMLTSALDLTRYAPRTYIISEGDTLSAKKAIAFEIHLQAAEPTPQDYRILRIPRARRVHQSLLTVPPTFMHSLLACIHLVTISPLLGRGTIGAPFVDLLILNGPGTCVTLCAAIVLNKLIGLPSPKMIYVESFARVESLSLTGRILRHVVDRFIVQWPGLLSADGREECYGCLV